MTIVMTTEEYLALLETAPLYVIAEIVRKDWRKPNGDSNVWFGAVPYLNAMGSLESVDDNYGADSGRSVVLYFLSNAAQWRGGTARAVKAELKRRTR